MLVSLSRSTLFCVIAMLLFPACSDNRTDLQHASDSQGNATVQVRSSQENGVANFKVTQNGEAPSVVRSQEHGVVDKMLGIIHAGTTHNLTYQIKNESGNTWEIISVDTECSCTATSLSGSRITPGSSAQLNVALTAPAQSQNLFKKTRVAFSAESHAPGQVLKH